MTCRHAGAARVADSAAPAVSIGRLIRMGRRCSVAGWSGAPGVQVLHMLSIQLLVQ